MVVKIEHGRHALRIHSFDRHSGQLSPTARDQHLDEDERLVEVDLAGAFLRPGQHASHHHAIGAGGDRLGHVAAKTNPAVGDNRRPLKAH